MLWWCYQHTYRKFERCTFGYFDNVLRFPQCLVLRFSHTAHHCRRPRELRKVQRVQLLKAAMGRLGRWEELLPVLEWCGPDCDGTFLLGHDATAACARVSVHKAIAGSGCSTSRIRNICTHANARGPWPASGLCGRPSHAAAYGDVHANPWKQ